MGSVKTDHWVNVQADLSDLVFHSSRLEETPDKCIFVQLQTWVLIIFCCLTPEKHMFNEYVIFNAYPQHTFSLRNEETFNTYDKCPKISNTRVSDKMAYANSADPDPTAPYANSADPDQTAPKGAV